MFSKPYVIAAVIIILLGISKSPADAANSVPAPAMSAGYNINTFSANFARVNFDYTNSGRSGFAWYPWNFFGSHAQIAPVALNSDGSATFNGDTTGPNGELATATPIKNSPHFVGTAFGGGAYIEGIFKFTPSLVAKAKSKGWPSFWSMAIEHLILGTEQWQGMPADYDQFIEADFFEYDLLSSGLAQNYYGGNLHDWYGIYKKTCSGQSFCDAALPFSDVKLAVPSTTDLTQYHRYGFLWVPATSIQSGYAQFFFDGTAIGNKITWTKFSNQSGPPVGKPWEFGVIDDQHLVLILGTGVNEPMTVQSVNVWQASATNNLRN